MYIIFYVWLRGGGLTLSSVLVNFIYGYGVCGGGGCQLVISVGMYIIFYIYIYTNIVMRGGRGWGAGYTE